MPDGIFDVIAAAHLADGVHGKLGDAHVHAPNARHDANVRPDCRATRAVAPDDELLVRDARAAPALMEDVLAVRVCDVTHLAVHFDNHALVHRRLVPRLVEQTLGGVRTKGKRFRYNVSAHLFL